MNILPDEVYRAPAVPDLEKLACKAPTPTEIANAALAIKSAVMENGTQFIYDEDKFKAFIEYVSKHSWLTTEEIETCRADLKKDSPQELLNLWIKTESVATPTWWVGASFEIGSGEFNVLRNYILASIIRSLTSLYYSRGVVENRLFTAAFEGIPHVGRVAPFIALAEEHPELTRMLWSYKACRTSFKRGQTDQDNQKLSHKFNVSRNSNLLEFIIDPSGFIRAIGIKHYTQSEVIRLFQSAGLALGLK